MLIINVKYKDRSYWFLFGLNHRRFKVKEKNRETMTRGFLASMDIFALYLLGLLLFPFANAVLSVTKYFWHISSPLKNGWIALQKHKFQQKKKSSNKRFFSSSILPTFPGSEPKKIKKKEYTIFTGTALYPDNSIITSWHTKRYHTRTH